MSAIPTGWTSVLLGDVAETSLGKMLDRGRSRGLREVPYLRNVNVQWGRIDTFDLLSMELSDAERDRFGVRAGDLLVCEGGEIGRCAIWQGSDDYVAYQKALHRIRPGRRVLPRYLRYLLEHHSNTGVLRAHATGSTIQHLPQQQLRRLPVPLPPTEEQQRIVDVLEDHLSRLDAGEGTLRTAARRAERLELSVIKWALHRAGGQPVTIASLARSVRNGIFVSRPKAAPLGVPILRIGAVRRLMLDLSDLRYSEKTEAEINELGALLSAGDLLFTRYNGNPRFVGACAIVPKGTGPLTYPDKLIRVVVDRDLVLPEFLALACSVGAGRAAIQALVKTTSGQAGISGSDLKGIPVLIPDIEAQVRALDYVDEALPGVQHVSEEMLLAVHRSRNLRRALLAAAFFGKLTDGTTEIDMTGELAGV